MSHLPTERLAALVDEAPTAAELAHLASVRGVRARAGGVSEPRPRLAANESARIGAPLTVWESLRPSARRRRRDRFRPGSHRSAHASRAAALDAGGSGGFLVAGGVMGGRLSAGASLVPNATRATKAVASTSRPAPPARTTRSRHSARSTKRSWRRSARSCFTNRRRRSSRSVTHRRAPAKVRRRCARDSPRSIKRIR